MSFHMGHLRMLVQIFLARPFLIEHEKGLVFNALMQVILDAALF